MNKADKLVIREKESLAWGLRVLLLMLVGLVKIGAMEDSARIFILITVAAIWIPLEMSFHFRKLILRTKNCSYTNMFGKKREFKLNDIYAVYPKRNLQEAGYALVDKYGEYIAKIEKNMQNADQLILFLEKQKNVGIWNGNILKEYEVVGKTKPVSADEKKEAPVSRASMPETLIVKPNKLYLAPVWVFLSVFVGLVCYMCYGIMQTIQGDETFLAGVIMAGLGLILCFIVLMIEWMTLIPKYKNYCLTMSSDVCEMIDGNGHKVKFHLEDIEDVNEEVHGSSKHRQTYLFIRLKDGRDDIVLVHDIMMTNVQKVQSFVAYHKAKRETELSQ